MLKANDTGSNTVSMPLTIRPTKVSPNIPSSGNAVTFVIGEKTSKTVQMSSGISGAELIPASATVTSNDTAIIGNKLWNDDASLTFSPLANNRAITIMPNPSTGAAVIHAATPFALAVEDFKLRFGGTDVNIAGMTATTVASDDFTVRVDGSGALKLNPVSRDFNPDTSSWSGTGLTSVTLTGGPSLASFDIYAARKDGSSVNGTNFTALKAYFARSMSGSTGTLRGTGATAPANGKYELTIQGWDTASNSYTSTFTLVVGSSTLRLSPSRHTFYTGDAWSGATLISSAGFASGTMTGWNITAAMKDGSAVSNLIALRDYFTLSPPSGGTAVMTGRGSTPPATGTYVLTFTGSGTVGGVATNATADFTLIVSAGSSATPTIGVSPTSLVFAHNDLAAKTLTLTTTNSTNAPTVAAADVALLTVGAVVAGSTAGTYTVTVAPASTYAFGNANVDTSLTVSLSGAASRTVPVTLNGSNAGVGYWTNANTAQTAVIANATGITAANQSVLNASNVVSRYDSSNTRYDGLVNRWALAAYMGFSQSVSHGGALVNSFNNATILTLDPTGVGSTNDQNLYVPKDHADFRARYDIAKVFDSNNLLWLTDEIAPDFFYYDATSHSVRVNGVYAIVDGPAPSTAPTNFKLYRPAYGSQYGVAYSRNIDGTQYLIVYDGVTDGMATDPLMLAERHHSGSGGCDAGFGALAMLAGALAAFTFRRRD